MATIKDLYKNMAGMYGHYEQIKTELKEKLRKYIKFEFSVIYFEAEGFVILNESLALSVSVTSVIHMIDKGETITEDYFKKYGQ